MPLYHREDNQAEVKIDVLTISHEDKSKFDSDVKFVLNMKRNVSVLGYNTNYSDELQTTIYTMTVKFLDFGD